jgi:immune inhibitor A
VPFTPVRLLGLTLAAALGAAALALPATAAPPAGGPVTDPSAAAPSDQLPNPLADKQDALREAAVAAVLSGEATAETINGETVVLVGERGDTAPRDASRKSKAQQRYKGKQDQYVRLSREDTDQVFVMLAEFGNERHPDYPDSEAADDVTVFDGPLHNAIPEPDRTKDNSTIWQDDFSADYFRDLYFGSGRGVESLQTYLEQQSSNRYSVEGAVSEWTEVRYNEARYGRDDCGTNVCDNAWALVRDSADQWVADRLAAGTTQDELKAELAQFDQQDRYDYDGDGNFREPDGYLDHFQLIHAGGDQADGDPYQASDAIWSHRWYAFYDQIGTTGPAFNRFGGTEIGNTGIWIGDYTTQAENSGLSTIAHEYAHDLGLPDHYDTAAGGDNPVSWWTLMAQSRVSAKDDLGIATRAADLSAWDKLQLGWLDYEIVVAGQRRTLWLGPHEYNSTRAQGLVVVLPDKAVTTALPDPPEGEHAWWSGTDDDYTATMTRTGITLPADPATLTLQTSYNIEDCGTTPCDFAFVEVNAGSGWTALPGTGPGGRITDPRAGNGIDGASAGWIPATFDLSPYAGQTVALRVRYQTDGATAGEDPQRLPGLFVDDLKITAGGTTLFADGAESGANGWAFSGFAIVTDTLTEEFDHFYIASNREYVGYDRYLRTGPYNFGFPSKPRWVEKFPYQDGLLVSYWDTSYSDNNTSQHPGSGEILPIDAHPRPLYTLDGTLWRGRIQTYDAPFGLQKADSFTLHHQATGKPSYIRGQAGNPVFDDSNPNRYFDPAQPRVGVKVAGEGVRIRVLDESGTSVRVRVS